MFPILTVVSIMSIMIGFRHLETLEGHDVEDIKEFREQMNRNEKDPGLERLQETITRAWTVSTNANGYFGHDYHAHPPGDGTAHFTWKFRVKQPGIYKVYVNYAAAFDRASNAPFTVTDSKGETTVRVDQRREGGQWVHIGDFKYNKGDSAKISLSNHADGSVIADAIKIVEAGNPTNKLLLDNRTPTLGYEPIQQPLP